MFIELGEQFGLSKLELLGPDGAIDLEFEDRAANSEGTAMSRNLRADNFFPVRSDTMRQCNAIEAEIAQDLTDQVADGLQAPLASTAGAAAVGAVHGFPSTAR